MHEQHVKIHDLFKNLASKKKANNKYAFIIYLVITYKMTRIQNVGP